MLVPIGLTALYDQLSYVPVAQTCVTTLSLASPPVRCGAVALRRPGVCGWESDRWNAHAPAERLPTAPTERCSSSPPWAAKARGSASRARVPSAPPDGTAGRAKGHDSPPRTGTRHRSSARLGAAAASPRPRASVGRPMSCPAAGPPVPLRRPNEVSGSAGLRGGVRGGRETAIPAALHADLLILDRPGRAVVRRTGTALAGTRGVLLPLDALKNALEAWIKIWNSNAKRSPDQIASGSRASRASRCRR